MFPHLLDRFRNNSPLGAFLAGMDEANRRHSWIDNVDRAAIGNVNPKRDATLTRNQTIATGEFLVARHMTIDNRDFVAMNLLRGKQWPISNSNLPSSLAMNRIEPLQCFGLVVWN